MTGLLSFQKAMHGMDVHKLSFFDLAVIGTPDGIIDIESMKPKTYYASMVHDALYQYYSYHKITRKGHRQTFLEMMKEE